MISSSDAKPNENQPASGEARRYYGAWQDNTHASFFDQLGHFSSSELRAHYESFNDIRLLTERGLKLGCQQILEVGCATGDLYRYLRLARPDSSYIGVDVSAPAIARARRKYPSGLFHQVSVELTELVSIAPANPIVYCKDVVIHQTKPFEFMARLIALPGPAIIMRLRTRDQGATVLDPDRSCQWHYGQWVPYMVLNIDELVAFLRDRARVAEIVIMRNHMVLGGLHGRYLPKDCYDPSTGTAETAIFVRRGELPPGASPAIEIIDRMDANPRFPLWARALRVARRTLRRTIR